ncbi:MAG: class I SAM-dependent methyltransferase [Chitinispirillales bacterium]|jgi:SAM-dependent methyltransferase|nr:class I SAM-dependent methyltransferase [Chitinispirillales bacterium]
MQYDALAPMYDRLMSHVEYEEWADLITRVVAKFGLTASPDVIEVGAGTGILGSYLVDMGYNYIASDLSYSMCKQARSVRKLPVCVADGTYLPLKKQFDLALFLYDGINYLHSLDDYRKLFDSVYNVLAAGGLFLFDITTSTNSIKHFSDSMYFEDFDDFSYLRHSYFNKKNATQHNDFTIYSKSESNPKLYEKNIEEHCQKVFSAAQVEKSVPRDFFSVLGIWDGYTFRKYSSKSERIHFLLRKNGGL